MRRKPLIGQLTFHSIPFVLRRGISIATLTTTGRVGAVGGTHTSDDDSDVTWLVIICVSTLIPVEVASCTCCMGGIVHLLHGWHRALVPWVAPATISATVWNIRDDSKSDVLFRNS